MPERKPDQAVDAFSAPRSLLRAAQIEAKKRRMSKSGFYRYCLAKVIGYSEAQATEFAAHAGVGTFTVVAEEGGPSVPDVRQVKKQVVKYNTAKRDLKISQ